MTERTRRCARHWPTRLALSPVTSPLQTQPRHMPRSPRSGRRRSRVDGQYRDRRSQMRETVIVEAVRTPIGKRSGGLATMHAADLSAVVLRELVDRTGIDLALVDDVIWGCVSQVGDQSSNIGRYAVLAAGWPETIPGTTVN